MKSTIRLEIIAAKAQIQPPIAPILGQYGIPAAKFCQEFNDETKQFQDELIVRVKLVQKQGKITERTLLIGISKILQRLQEESNRISLESLYKLSLLIINNPSLQLRLLGTTHYTSTSIPQSEHKKILRTLISSVNSMHIPVVD